MKHTCIAYLMSRFPHLPETFILREMIELKRQGWDVAIYPLIYQKQSLQHADAEKLLPDVKDVSVFSLTMVRNNLKVCLQNPIRYFSTLFEALIRNVASPKFFIRTIFIFPKSVHISEKMAAEGVSHIHAHFASHPALAAWIIHRLTGISYSFTAHAHDLYVERPMLACKIKEAAFVTTISAFNREFISRAVGEWARDKIQVVHCGIRPEDYTGRQGERSPGSKFKILSIGSLQPYKGQQVLVDACAILRDRGLDFSCEIIGGGKLSEKLNRQISKLRLGGIVSLLGPRPQEIVAKILPTADCYVHPSVVTRSGKMEGIPVAIMEAFACRVPVVATNISGIPELVVHEKTGLLVEAGDAHLLADAIERIYHEPAYAQQLARAGSELVLREFTVETNTEKLSVLFTKKAGPLHRQDVWNLSLRDTTVLSSPKMEE